MRLLVCGSRKWGVGNLEVNAYDYSNGPQCDPCSEETKLAWALIQGYHSLGRLKTIIHGCAPGADSAAWSWALNNENPLVDQRRVEHLAFPADWKGHGRAAGYIRNKKMLTEGKPDLVLAFSHDLANSKGTKMMVEIAEKAKVPTYIVGTS